MPLNLWAIWQIVIKLLLRLPFVSPWVKLLASATGKSVLREVIGLSAQPTGHSAYRLSVNSAPQPGKCCGCTYSYVFLPGQCRELSSKAPINLRHEPLQICALLLRCKPLHCARLMEKDRSSATFSLNIRASKWHRAPWNLVQAVLMRGLECRCLAPFKAEP